MQRKNRPVERGLANARVQASPRDPARIGDPAEALLAPQDLHDFEDPRRGERTGQSGAQRLRHRAELDSLLIGKGADLSSSGSGCHSAPRRGRSSKSAEQPRASAVSSFAAFVVEPDRPRRDQKTGIGGELDR